MSREALVALVRKLMDPPEGAGEKQVGRWVRRLEKNVPDPMVADYLFHSDAEMTAEQVVDRALAYRPPDVGPEELERLLDEFLRINAPGRGVGYLQNTAEEERHRVLYPILASRLGTEPNELAFWANENRMTAADVIKLHREGKLGPRWRRMFRRLVRWR